MAEVWRADAIFEDGTAHPVAIKRVLPNLANDKLYRSMFEDEARLGMLLRHPNIVRVYDARDAGGTFIMVMELVEGSSLKGVLDVAHEQRVPVPVPLALHIVRALAHSLDYAHTATDLRGRPMNIVHRDVSPHNMLVGYDGQVKLMDFGLADATVHETVRSEELIGGKLGYLAPEVVRSQRTTNQIDLFGAGIILWEMLTGQRLFQGDNDTETVQNVARKNIAPPSQYNAMVPGDVDAYVGRMLARDPRRRVQTANQMATALDILIRRLDPSVGPAEVSKLVQRFVPRTSKVDTGLDVAMLLSQELEAFAAGGGYVDMDVGAMPLDPSDFDF